MQITKKVEILLHCEKHSESAFWKHDSLDGFYEFLKSFGWGYEFQDTTEYYCPKCLKELGLSAGQVDIRGTL